MAIDPWPSTLEQINLCLFLRTDRMHARRVNRHKEQPNLDADKALDYDTTRPSTQARRTSEAYGSRRAKLMFRCPRQFSYTVQSTTTPSHAIRHRRGERHLHQHHMHGDVGN